MAGQKSLKNSLFVHILLLFVYLIFITSCAVFQKDTKAENVLIDNQVKECLEILPLYIIYKHGATYINAKIRSIKSTGYCGCKSALLSYRVYGIKQNDNSMLHYDSLSSLNHNGYDFFVCNGSAKNYDHLKIDIQCKNPE